MTKISVFLLSCMYYVNNCNAIITNNNYNFRYVGSTKPLVSFDPLNLVKNKSENKVKFIRESELQHGRLAMLASLFIPLIEQIDDKKLGINYLSSMDFKDQLPFWYFVSLIETFRLIKGWENPFTSKDTFQLKRNYQPGNLFDCNMNNISDNYMNIELNNGRLAMVAVIGQIFQELVTNKPLF